MLTLEAMQQVIIRGADIREASYDRDKQRYTKSCMEACVEACPQAPEMGYLIGLALDGWWNDTLEWAEKPHKG